MNNMAKQAAQKQRKMPIHLVVQQEFVGEKSINAVMFPIIYEDLRRQLVRRTLDKDNEIK